MDILRKEIPVEINGEVYKLVLDFEAAMNFQKYYGKSILVGLDAVSKEQDIVALGCLIAACLKAGEGKDEKSVGLEFIEGLDFMNTLPIFMEAIPELVDNSLPKEDKKNKKK